MLSGSSFCYSPNKYYIDLLWISPNYAKECHTPHMINSTNNGLNPLSTKVQLPPSRKIPIPKFYSQTDFSWYHSPYNKLNFYYWNL